MDLDDHLPGLVAGDTAAFGRWVAGAEPRLRGALRPFARQVDTEAILQETLLRIWQVAPSVVPDGRPNALLRLAFVTQRNLAISAARRNRVGSVDEEQLTRLADAQATEPELPDPLLRALIALCLQKLTGKPRAALQARIDARGGQHDLDLAQGLQMQLNTFLQNVTRARKALAACLERQGVTLPGAEAP